MDCRISEKRVGIECTRTGLGTGRRMGVVFVIDPIAFVLRAYTGFVMFISLSEWVMWIDSRLDSRRQKMRGTFDTGKKALLKEQP